MKVDLTRPQIEALLRMTSSFTEYNDALTNLCIGNLIDINTSIRAVNKLKQATNRPQIREWDKTDLNY